MGRGDRAFIRPTIGRLPMKKWLKRIRGVLGTGLTWAAAWGVVGTMLRIVAGAIAGSPFGGVTPIASVVVMLVTFGAMGFVGGVAFSTVLGITEGRRRFDQMSLPRFAAWGGVGGLLLFLFIRAAGSGFQMGLEQLILGGTVILLGAGSAAGSLALARRAGNRELLDAGADVADIGLTEEEKRELLTE